MVGLFDYDNDNVPGISVTTSVLIAPEANPGRPGPAHFWDILPRAAPGRSIPTLADEPSP
ncbi:hypothetical protein [uncultured Thiodictyon sp.]|uniref:hypothetical protein n=1 Tax=uncultured Thiodictyon sp. TaxID=1846217 RepID=UPI0025E04099|nr:hypothetical protein [uncultured Thiodictyon sp.]